jgi:hypothetical protein
MRAFLNWSAAAASLIGLFFTLYPYKDNLSPLQISVLFVISIIFTVAAFFDIREARRRGVKKYSDNIAINKYMHSMLKKSGFCEICSRDASWISDDLIWPLLEEKSKNGEITFFVHKTTPDLQRLAKAGATIIEYGSFGFDPLTRFTIVNAGNATSSYVAIGSKKPNEPHVIEELDSSHPTYALALDLVRTIKKFK